MRELQLGVHHEVEATERLVGLIDAMNEVQQRQREVDEERVEQVLGDGIDAAHVDLLAACPAQKHIRDHYDGNARDHCRGRHAEEVPSVSRF